MGESRHFALLVLVVAAFALAAVLAGRFTERLRIPAPALVLAAAAIVAHYASGYRPSAHLVEDIVTVALVVILFDGGRHLGWRRIRPSLGPIATLGVLSTFVTAVLATVFLHLAFAIGWYPAALVAIAVAPTDPALVFAVLGRREIEGRSGTILEGESGANDPVGIALMAGLIAAGGLSAHAAGYVAGQFVLQMAVGLAVGVVGGRAVLGFARRVALPTPALHSLRLLACAFVLFGVAAVAHGSGFLAVFVAGILLGDEPVDHQVEVEHFHSALAGLSEIAAFAVLGLTVDLSVLGRADVLVPGLILGVVLALVIRPLAVAPALLPSGLAGNEIAFVAFAGLKGAVPLLLGVLVLGSGLAGAERWYGIVVVAVVVSVLGPGSLVPTAARRLRIPMRDLD